MGDEPSEDCELLHAFVDTNALVEYHSPPSVDWCKAVRAKRVRVVITPVVIRELQQLKDSKAKLGKRNAATERLKWLEENLSAPPDRMKLVEVRPGVDMVFDGKAVPEELFKQHHLDPTLPDDRLVAQVLARRDDWRVCLVTNDAGPRLLGRSLGLPCFNMQEKRPPKEAEEGASGPKPDLEFGFVLPGSGDPFHSNAHVAFGRSLTHNAVDELVDAMERILLERFERFAPAVPEGSIRSTMERVMGHDRTGYMTSVRRYLERAKQTPLENNLRARCGFLQARIRNKGKRPARVVVELRLANDAPYRWVLRDFNYDELMSLPLPKANGLLSSLPAYKRGARSPWTGSSKTVRFEIERLMHDPDADGVWTKLFLPYITCDSPDETPPRFDISYRLHEDGMTQPVKGRFHVEAARRPDAPLIDLAAYRKHVFNH